MEKLNLIKKLALSTYGSNQVTLQKIYHALILTWGQRTKYRKNSTIHNSATRLCIGTFRISPTHSLIHAAEEWPLELRRRRQCTLTYPSLPWNHNATTFSHTRNISFSTTTPSNNSFKNTPKLHPLTYRISSYRPLSSTHHLHQHKQSLSTDISLIYELENLLHWCSQIRKKLRIRPNSYPMPSFNILLCFMLRESLMLKLSRFDTRERTITLGCSLKMKKESYFESKIIIFSQLTS